MIDLSSERVLDMYRTMLRIRYFEETVDQLFSLGKVWGTGHLYIGEEAVAVGAIAALWPDDYIVSTHRGHGHCLAKGASVTLMMAELMGKKEGYCRGIGGSMHIADLSSGNLGANGVVGGGVPIAVGAALASQMRKDGRVTLCFFGDGAANQGGVHEALNMAAVWHLPIVFAVENNQYAMSTPLKRSFAIPRISDRAACYGFPGVTVDGNDIFSVFRAASEAVDRARNGGGPTLMECVTYRWKGHSKSDANKYRTREEIKNWMERCPILRMEEYLVASKILNEEGVKKHHEEVKSEISDALASIESCHVLEYHDMLESVYA